MTTSDDPEDKKMLQHIQAHVMQALADYAKGGNNVTVNVKPFGLQASRSTKAFKKVRSSFFALTLAEMYSVVAVDEHLVDKWVKKTRPHITAPWPRGTILRFFQMRELFCDNRYKIFEAYEDLGGEYVGEAPTPRKKRKRAHEPALDDLDNEFE